MWLAMASRTGCSTAGKSTKKREATDTKASAGHGWNLVFTRQCFRMQYRTMVLHRSSYHLSIEHHRGLVHLEHAQLHVRRRSL